MVAYGTNTGCVLAGLSDGYYVVFTGTYVVVQIVNNVIVDFPECTTTTTTTTSLPIVIICSQEWTLYNLDVTTYSDGTTQIPQVTDNIEWRDLTTGAWCYYNNDPTNNATYEKLYNWYAVAGIYDEASLNTPSLRKQLAPTGYHIPTNLEWYTIIECLGGESLAGGKMKATGTIQAGTGLWESPNEGATNESGFTSLPGGARNWVDGEFNNIGYNNLFWSSSEVGATYAWYSILYSSVGFAYRLNDNKASGFSVRVIKD